MLKKSCVSLISLAMLLSLFAGFGANKASASSIDKPEQIVVEELNENDGISTTSVGSYAVKKALKWAINNTTSITNYVGKFFGKDAAVKVGNVMHSHVKPALKKLEKVEDLTYGKMESAIEDALEPVMGGTAARISAGFIVQAIEILAPV